jgi:hypothetical protein
MICSDQQLFGKAAREGAKMLFLEDCKNIFSSCGLNAFSALSPTDTPGSEQQLS